MNQWFHVQQIGKGPDRSWIPAAPTFIWLNTAYYAGKRAEVYYGSSAMGMVIVAVKPSYVFPEDAIELVDDTDGDGGVHAVPLRNARERTNEPARRTILRKLPLAKGHARKQRPS